MYFSVAAVKLVKLLLLPVESLVMVGFNSRTLNVWYIYLSYTSLYHRNQPNVGIEIKQMQVNIPYIEYLGFALLDKVSTVFQENHPKTIGLRL